MVAKNKNELKTLWQHQPKEWRAQYLRSLGSNHPALNPGDARMSLVKRLSRAHSAYATARSTGNPLWIWYAYREFRVHGLPLPEWMLVYFDEVAKRLCAMVLKPPSDSFAAIAYAMLMKRLGRGNVFTRFQNPAEIGVIVELLNAMGNRKPANVAIGCAAQTLGVDKRTVRRARDSFVRRARERDVT